MIKIAIADDHEMFAQGIASLLEGADGLSVNLVVKNGEELIARLPEFDIDILLLDVDMPGLDGADTLLAVKKLWPDIKVIMLTMHDEASFVKKFLELEVEGYVLKNTGRDQLLKAIKWVYEGNQFIESKLLLKVNKANQAEQEKASILSALTEREMEIVKLTGKEYSIPKISKELFVSENTVKTHRKNIMRKLKLSNSIGIVKFAIEYKLI